MTIHTAAAATLSFIAVAVVFTRLAAAETTPEFLVDKSVGADAQSRPVVDLHLTYDLNALARRFGSSDLVVLSEVRVASQPAPYLGSAELRDEACVHISSSPEAREGNVARFFWDLYDTTTVDEASGGTCLGSSPYLCEICSYGGFDALSLSIDDIIDTWSSFDKGTADRETEESGDSGRNAWDFWHHYNGGCAALRLNCLGDQVE